MKCIAWPNMFSGNAQTTNILQEKEAVGKTLELLFNSEKGECFGDPYFGVHLKPILFEQNSPILTDLLIDRIHSAIVDYIPQVTVTRNDISIRRDSLNLYGIINVVYNIDNTSDLYSIQLTNNIQEE